MCPLLGIAEVAILYKITNVDGLYNGAGINKAEVEGKKFMGIDLV